MADAEQHHRFFVTIGGGKPREMDLTDEEGAWRVLLLDDRGRMVRPVEIQALGGGTPSERAYFPAMSAFRRAFRLVFPAVSRGWPTHHSTRSAVRRAALHGPRGTARSQVGSSRARNVDVLVVSLAGEIRLLRP